MGKYKFTMASVIFSIICIGTVLKTNYDILLLYLAASGKTQALFSIVVLLRFHYAYYFAGLGLIAIILAIFSFKRKESKIGFKMALILAVLSFLSVFIPLWKLVV